MQQETGKIKLGWREWISLPELNVLAIKTKVDTGAKTSALHAFYVERYQKNSVDMVELLIQRIQSNSDVQVECHDAILDGRKVADSSGHKEKHYIIQSLISIGDQSWPIELSLTNRDTMRFRMLLGRRAMENGVIVDPGASYINGKLDPKTLYDL